jgi:hypothetical protein
VLDGRLWEGNQLGRSRQALLSWGNAGPGAFFLFCE